MKPIPVGYFCHHADSGWQQTSYRDLDEWRADLKNYADCDRDDTPPIPLYRYSELFDAAYGTPCQQVAWQQELERLKAEAAELRAERDRYKARAERLRLLARDLVAVVRDSRRRRAELVETLVEHEAQWRESGTAQLDEIERLRAEVEALTEENARIKLNNISAVREVERTHDDASALISRNAELRERATIAEAEVEALRADAERYRWLRERMELRPMPTMKGTVRHGMTTRIGCAYPDAPLPRSTNPEYHEEQSKKLDAAIDDARAAK